MVVEAEKFSRVTTMSADVGRPVACCGCHAAGFRLSRTSLVVVVMYSFIRLPTLMHGAIDTDLCIPGRGAFQYRGHGIVHHCWTHSIDDEFACFMIIN